MIDLFTSTLLGIVLLYLIQHFYFSNAIIRYTKKVYKKLVWLLFKPRFWYAKPKLFIKIFHFFIRRQLNKIVSFDTKKDFSISKINKCHSYPFNGLISVESFRINFSTTQY